MKIIKPSVEVIALFDGETALKHIEKVGRICYKSEDKITEDSSIKFAQDLIKRGHEAVIEHSFITAIFTCDRGVTHEIVRHRLFSFAQESTRYCNYSKDKFGNELTFIEPCFWGDKNLGYEADEQYKADCKQYNSYYTREDKTFNVEEYDKNYALGKRLELIEVNAAKYKSWINTLEVIEEAYLELIKEGATPQEARSILPNSLKTEIVVSGNFREWRHFFDLRTAKAAHPQMREVANMALEQFKQYVPVIFDSV